MYPPTKHLTHPNYRADIDGLRAIAVLSVVGFHAFPKAIKGGFVGVDIFFVISGFLISTIIFGSLERNAFSFTEFYGRRIRRIFPALFVVLTTCFVGGWFVLFADEYKQLGKHMAGGAGFVSNYVLWNESGYFDNVAETKPLLHLWSLGIEEQFYIVWPFLLWLAWKKHFNFLKITIVIAAISFSLNIAKYHSDPVADFYSPQTRFWELLAGSTLAYLRLHNHRLLIGLRKRLNAWPSMVFNGGIADANGMILRNVPSMLGMLLIATGILVINKEWYFPGFWVLLPVLGTAMVITSGAHAWLNRVVLSNQVLVWFGLISFPLYLWHWPLLSFARIIQGETPSRTLRVIAVLISIVLAWMTYKWIERPLRFGKRGKIIITILFLIMITIGCAGYYTYNKDGLPFRKAASPTRVYEGDIGHIEFHKYPFSKYYLCTPKRIAIEALKWEGYVRCLQSQKNKNIEIALIGDSHAEHLFIGLADQLPQKNIAFFIKGGAPFIGNNDFASIYKYVLSSKTIKKVILTMYWPVRLTQVPAGSDIEKEILKISSKLIQSGKEVYITDDVPSFPFDPQKCALKRVLSSSQLCTIEKKDADKTSALYSLALNNVIHQDPRIKLLGTQKYFCNSKNCSMVKNGELLYRDNNHLNINGSKYLGKKIVLDYPFFQ